MTTPTRRVATALACVLALGIGSAIWATSSASAASAAAPRCTASSLAVWVNADNIDGAAGTLYSTLEFSNTGHHACTLYGYPGVSAVTGAGRLLGAAATRDSATPARTVTIPAGGTAHGILEYHDAVVSPACHPRTPFWLRVYPPNDRGARHAFFPLPVCTDKSADLTVQRVAAGINP